MPLLLILVDAKGEKWREEEKGKEEEKGRERERGEIKNKSKKTQRGLLVPKPRTLLLCVCVCVQPPNSKDYALFGKQTKIHKQAVFATRTKLLQNQVVI